MKKILVCGAGGFIGGAMLRRLKEEGYWVRGIDIKEHEFFNAYEVADEFVVGDLRDPNVCEQVVSDDIDEIYQFAADMGGAGFCFTGENDADILHNSALINLNIAHQAVKKGVKRIFYSSSACMYPEHNQMDPNNPKCSEDSAYPADLEVRIARYHNIFGPFGTWEGGREKAPAALCRKVGFASDGELIEVWGDGKQTRSFLYIDQCIEATRRLMDSDFIGPVNIGSEEMVSINHFTNMIIDISGKNLSLKHIPGPQGVRGRNSDTKLYLDKVGWVVDEPLIIGLEKTYNWIKKQLDKH